MEGISLEVEVGMTLVLGVGLGKDWNSISKSIRDHGTGITHKGQNLIFEPFYRVDMSLDSESNNYDLGLNLCKTILEVQGSGIRVGNELGTRSIFILKFSSASNTVGEKNQGTLCGKH